MATIPNSNRRFRSMSSASGISTASGTSQNLAEIEEDLPSPSLRRASNSSLLRDTPVNINSEMEDRFYIAVDKKYKESKHNLVYALKLDPTVKKFFLLHIHCPSQMIPMMGGMFPASSLTKQQVMTYHLYEREKLDKALGEYMLVCRTSKVQAELLVIEKDDIAKGLVEVITQLGIRRLVMGAAADRYYSSKMKTMKSKKACIIQKEAHPSCKIWFVCKGNLIYTREANLDGHLNELPVASPSISSVNGSPESTPSTSSSVSVNESPGASPSSTRATRSGPSLSKSLYSGVHGFFRNKSKATNDAFNEEEIVNPLHEMQPTRPSNPQDRREDSLVWDGIRIPKGHHASNPSSWSGGDEVGSSMCSSSVPKDGESDAGSLMCHSIHDFEDHSLIVHSVHAFEDNSSMVRPIHDFEEVLHVSSAHDQQEGLEVDDLYDKLQQAFKEVEDSKVEAYEQSRKRSKAEREAVAARRRAKDLELRYAQEVKLRSETEEVLAREKLEMEDLKRKLDEICKELQKAHNQKKALEIEVNNLKMQHTEEMQISEELTQGLKRRQDEITEELQKVIQQKLASEIQVTKSEHVVKDFTEKMSLMQRNLDSIQIEQEELRQKWVEATREVEELRQAGKEVGSISCKLHNFSEFSYAEIDEATRGFERTLCIGEGGYGTVYKGFLHHTTVAIKMLQSGSLQGKAEFYQEIDVLSRVRHPNLVTLIGACLEEYALVYEFLPNGSLEDRLACAGNTAPLSWQVRIRICAEICSALIFLHSNKPQCVVHGDLKPANILLDANFTSKLSDFGISRLLVQSIGATTVFHRTDPKGTFCYTDPEFTTSGVLTPQSDVYSFGIIILQLLTGKFPLGLVKLVKDTLKSGKIQEVLDPSAGAWPFVQAQQLANLAVRCCELNRKMRPDLVKEVWRLLEPMKNASLGPLSSGSPENEKDFTPSYFICPIFQEIMTDPHVAADGFTYEAEALKGWLETGHDTSPMTNMKLDNDRLIPNHALRSAIQEWLQQH